MAWHFVRGAQSVAVQAQIFLAGILFAPVHGRKLTAHRTGDRHLEHGVRSGWLEQHRKREHDRRDGRYRVAVGDQPLAYGECTGSPNFQGHEWRILSLRWVRPSSVVPH
jgi:hypothetical protein